MDWDDTIFDRGELLSHLDDLQISHYYELDELLVRTTKNTRTGNEFSFMLTELALGSLVGDVFYSGFQAEIHRNGPDPHRLEGNATLPSSFWIRFKEEVRPSCWLVHDRSLHHDPISS